MILVGLCIDFLILFIFKLVKWGMIPQALLTMVVLEGIHFAEDITYIGFRIQKNYIGTDMEVSAMLTSFHKTWNCSVGNWERKVSNPHLSKLWILHGTKPTSQAACACWCNGGTTVVSMNKEFLIRPEICYIGGSS